jgi:hypothetical protein
MRVNENGRDFMTKLGLYNVFGELNNASHDPHLCRSAGGLLSSRWPKLGRPGCIREDGGFVRMWVCISHAIVTSHPVSK